MWIFVLSSGKRNCSFHQNPKELHIQYVYIFEIEEGTKENRREELTALSFKLTISEV
jgi:hypothetical protein